MVLMQHERRMGALFAIALLIWTVGYAANEPMSFWAAIAICLGGGVWYGIRKGQQLEPA